MNPGTQRTPRQKGSAMSTTYPLAIINTASITSLVRMTPCDHVYHAKIETNEGMAALGKKARNTAAENPVTSTRERQSRWAECEEPDGHRV
jgi:hypothetical protein